MKHKIKLTIATSILSLGLANAQNGSNSSNWKMNGNNAANGDFLGTTTNVPLVFKTNNATVGSFGTNGLFKINAFATGATQFLYTDANGILQAKPLGTAGQYLDGTGNWVNLPTSGTSGLWNQSGNNVYWNASNGKVGIGTNSPIVTLDVIGDARISNNLYVGGGVVITDKVDASVQIKGFDFKVDNDLDVQSKTRLRGVTQLDQGFTFDGSMGMKLVSNNSGGGTFLFGNNNSPVPSLPYCAAQPTTAANFAMGGTVQIFDPANPTTSGLMNMQAFGNGAASIDASVGANPGLNAGLLLNYFCGNNTFINTGLGGPNSDGGNIYMGSFVNARKHFEIGDHVNLQTAFNDPNNVALEINESAGKGLLFRTNNSSTALISVENSSITGNSPFVVYGNGKTYIGSGRPKAGSQVDGALLSVDGLVFAKEVFVAVSNNYWADYVFTSSYKLKPLSEIKKYTMLNRHLPNVPSASEIEKSGLNIAEMQKIQMEKIEELYLYLIQLEEKVEALKLENEKLKKQ